MLLLLSKIIQLLIKCISLLLLLTVTDGLQELPLICRLPGIYFVIYNPYKIFNCADLFYLGLPKPKSYGTKINKLKKLFFENVKCKYYYFCDILQSLHL